MTTNGPARHREPWARSGEAGGRKCNEKISEKFGIMAQLHSAQVSNNVHLSEKTRINEELEARTSEVNNLQHTNALLRDENTQITSEKRALTKELQAATDEKQAITSDLERKGEELTSIQSTAVSITADLATAKDTIEKQRHELQAATNDLHAVTTSKGVELAQIRRELAQTNAELATANETIEEQRQEIKQHDDDSLDSEGEEDAEEYVYVNHNDDPDDLFTTGTKVQVRIDNGKHQGNWKAEIVKRCDKNNETGFHIHYKGSKYTKRKKYDWVAYVHIVSVLLRC